MFDALNHCATADEFAPTRQIFCLQQNSKKVHTAVKTVATGIMHDAAEELSEGSVKTKFSKHQYHAMERGKNVGSPR